MRCRKRLESSGKIPERHSNQGIDARYHAEKALGRTESWLPFDFRVPSLDPSQKEIYEGGGEVQ